MSQRVLVIISIHWKFLLISNIISKQQITMFQFMLFANTRVENTDNKKLKLLFHKK